MASKTRHLTCRFQTEKNLLRLTASDLGVVLSAAEFPEESDSGVESRRSALAKPLLADLYALAISPYPHWHNGLTRVSPVLYRDIGEGSIPSGGNLLLFVFVLYIWYMERRNSR